MKMRPIRLFFNSIIAILALTSFTSCSDDDNNEPLTPAAREIAGTYTGDLTCTVMNSPSTYENLSFTVTATDETTVTITLPAFGEAPMALPSITLPGLKVSDAGGTYTIPETEISGKTDNDKNFTCTVQASVSGKTLNINYSLKYGAMPMALICSSTAIK